MTIAAISTPPAVGGLAVIRLSGPDAIPISAKLFTPISHKNVSEMPGYTCAYGHVSSGGATLDDAILTVFRAPKSYTGEDVCEISCHGGLYVSRRILREALSLGAEPAGPGEFTKRAFMNGKISLTQAEAVADIISAEGEAALSSANLVRGGALYEKSKQICNKLVNVLGSLAAWTDYPDEDIPETSPAEIVKVLEDCSGMLKNLVSSYDSGIIFREGISCAIVGRPNVGKSTLMNALLGYQRSIVTSAAGTTRDVVEERLRLGDVILRLSDTAGIRHAEDEVERLGVELAERAISSAQLILAVFDGSEQLTDEDKQILEMTKNRRRIVIINKTDLPQSLDPTYFSDEYILSVEAKTGSGVEQLKDAVYKMFHLSAQTGSGEIYANERQKACLDKALKHVDDARAAILAGETFDAVTVCIDAAAGELMALSGERVSDAVVADVFSRFCVGK